MLSKEKLHSLLDSLDENDRKTAYQFVKSLVQPDEEQPEDRTEEEPEDRTEVTIFGKDYFIIRD